VREEPIPRDDLGGEGVGDKERESAQRIERLSTTLGCGRQTKYQRGGRGMKYRPDLCSGRGAWWPTPGTGEQRNGERREGGRGERDTRERRGGRPSSGWMFYIF
jgi:hypothetical protein